MPCFMRAIDRVHAERQLLAAFSEQMGWSDINLFFKRLRIPRPEFDTDSSHTLLELTRGYLAGCSDDVLLDIAHQLGLDIAPEEHKSRNIIKPDCTRTRWLERGGLLHYICSGCSGPLNGG